MKVKECPSCAVMIGRDEKDCPVCGYEFPEESKYSKYITSLIIIILIVLMLLYFL